MEKRLIAVDEPLPGAAAQAWIAKGADFVAGWLGGAVRNGAVAPGPEECRARLAADMPELLAGYDAALALAGDQPYAHWSLSGIDAPGFMPNGCSVRAVARPEPTMIRNYDFAADATSGVVLRSRWNGRTIVGTAEGVTGYLDGVNDAGLACAITFGGSHVYGRGHSILAITRCLLESCGTVAEASARVKGLTCAWSQNLLLLDAAGNSAVARLAPDRPTRVEHGRAVTNHQSDAEARDNSMLRWRAADGLEGDAEAVAAAFFRPPIYGTDDAGWMATIYTALYRPGAGAVEYRWPGQPSWTQSVDRFTPGERMVRMPVPG
jgi:predicted choloylglycine hydrolase